MVRTGLAYKREARREQKRERQRQKQKGGIKRTEREQREREKIERKKGTQTLKCHQVLTKKKEYKENRSKSKRDSKEILDRGI